MAIQLYKISNKTEKETIATYVDTIKISGKEGIISKFIQSKPNDDLEDWAISPNEIASLVGLEKSDYIILFTSKFENSDESSISKMKSLTGKSNLMDTEVLFMLQPLKDSVIRNEGTITFLNNQTLENVFESVLVKGGVSKLNHSWKLAPPKMQIGGVIR